MHSLSPPVIDKFNQAVVETDPELEEFLSLLLPLTLSCGAVGFPDPSITWYKDGAPLPGETGRTLTIAEVDVEDRGRYWCSAENFDPDNLMSLFSDTSEEVVVNILGNSGVMGGRLCFGKAAFFWPITTSFSININVFYQEMEPLRTPSGPAILSLSFVERCPLSEVIFYGVCIQEYFQLVLCWEVCPLSECPLTEVSL